VLLASFTSTAGGSAAVSRFGFLASSAGRDLNRAYAAPAFLSMARGFSVA